MMKTLKAYGFCFAIVQLLIACGPAPVDQSSNSIDEATTAVANTEDAAVPETLVLAFGDSLYAGYGLPPDQGFVPELQKALGAKGKDVKVHNAGVSGDTTAAGLRRLNFVLDSLPKKPDLVLLGLGGNDLLRGLKPQETRKNLEQMVQKLTEREIPILLTGMIAPPNLGPEYGKEFNGIYPVLAKKYGADLYPFFVDGLVGRSELILDDGIHPNAEGIDVIVEKITPQVVASLEK